jgi:hypothetical protein
MSTIDSYIKQTAKKYPHTKEVAEQLEEIRDTLHIKTEEFQAQGQGYEEAAQAAIDSIGDISALMSDVAGESRSVYISRLLVHVSVIAMITVSVEFFLAFASSVAPVYSDSVVLEILRRFLGPISIVHVGVGDFASVFWPGCFPVLVAVWVWPAVSIIKFILEPRKIAIVQMHFKQQMKIAWIGLAAGAAALFLLYLMGVLNEMDLPYRTIDIAFKRVSLWFVWPVIFLSNWPLIIWNYGRMLRSGKYDA